MTQLTSVRCRVSRSLLFVLVISALGVPILSAQTDEFRVYSDAPRLLLTPQRLRLLKRERERQSMRWQQFDTLIMSGAPLPEPGFALALHYRVSGQAASGKRAVDWALSEKAADTIAGRSQTLRQLALVFDWCGAVMSPAQTDNLATKIQRALAAIPVAPGNDAGLERSQVFAAIALADRLPDHAESLLKPIVEQWWRAGVVKRIAATNIKAEQPSGQAIIPRDQIYALYELLHVLRDNLKLDLREDSPVFFKALPTDHLVSHYPAPFNAPENEYRIPVYVRDGDPDLIEAALSRAAELAMVAFDSNAAETQFLQGWLMQDRFLMRGEFGAPYEFLWANPYQPGLSYFQVPLVYHNSTTGHIFARTSWDEDATWLGYFDGHLQLVRDGPIQTLKSGVATEPVHVGDAIIVSARSPEAFRFRADAEAVFVLNLTPHAVYDVEIDDQELSEEETDVGGIMVLSLPDGVSTGIRIKKRQ